MDKLEEDQNLLYGYNSMHALIGWYFLVMAGQCFLAITN